MIMVGNHNATPAARKNLCAQNRHVPGEHAAQNHRGSVRVSKSPHESEQCKRAHGQSVVQCDQLNPAKLGCLWSVRVEGEGPYPVPALGQTVRNSDEYCLGSPTSKSWDQKVYLPAKANGSITRE